MGSQFEINYINIFGTSSSVDTALSNSGSPSATAGQSKSSASTTTTGGVQATSSQGITGASSARSAYASVSLYFTALVAGVACLGIAILA